MIHDFRLLTEELGRRDTQLQRFVVSSSDALGAFASQQNSIQLALQELPATLRTAQLGLGSSNKLSLALRPTLTALIPQAQASPAAFRANTRFFKQTVGPIRRQIRPFTRIIRPTVLHASQTAKPFATTVKGFGERRSGRSTTASTSSPTSRRTSRATSSTCPGSTTTSTPPTWSRAAPGRCGAA